MKQSSEVDIMPRKIDESKYQQATTVERLQTRRLSSAIKADQERDKRVDSIRLRVPAGWREVIQEYVVTLPDYQITNKKQPAVDPKPNVNKWLVDMIRNNLPESVANQLPDDSGNDKIDT